MFLMLLKENSAIVILPYTVNNTKYTTYAESFQNMA